MLKVLIRLELSLIISIFDVGITGKLVMSHQVDSDEAVKKVYVKNVNSLAY